MAEEEVNNLELLLNRVQAFNTDRKLYRQGFGDHDTVSENPLNFYDRHLHPSLALARVELTPSMVQLFSDICDEQLSALLAKGPSSYRRSRFPTNSLESSRSWDIAHSYPENLGKFCHLFPSKLYIDPKRRDLFTVFNFHVRRTSEYRPTFGTEAFISMNSTYSRTPHYVSPDTLLPDDGLEDYHGSDFKRPDMAEINAHSPQLAIWEFYPMNLAGEKLIRTMHEIKRFEWVTSQTKGHSNASTFLSSPPANDEAAFFYRLINKSAKKPTSTPRPKETRTWKSSKLKVARTEKESGVIPSSTWRTNRPYRVDAVHFLQHAWARAVVNDATFIIFNCGRYERIGFRHRASQTLYLSGLIDTVTCQNPAYGKLHLGLHFSVVEDAVHRQLLRLDPPLVEKLPDAKPAISKKRPSPEMTTITKKTNDSKPRRLDRELGAMSAELDGDSLPDELIPSMLSERNLALINLNYGAYKSSVPSSFIRKGPSCAPGFYRDAKSFIEPDRRGVYLPHQYFSLNLVESKESGATGTVHRATAEIRMKGGEIIHHSLIVKLVFLDRDIRPREEWDFNSVITEEDRLLNEYSVYQHLAAAGVIEGIIPIYGLFEDIDSGTLALIMEDGGRSLKSIQLETSGLSGIAEKERNALVHAMKSIHKAGIRHRDIRAENIWINSTTSAFIIDFDRAEFMSPPSEALDRELLLMQHIVDLGAQDPKVNYYSF